MVAPSRVTRRTFVLGDSPRTPGGRLRSRRASRGRSERSVGKILLLGRLRELALYRSEFLQGKGYEVIAPTSRSETLDVIRRGAYDCAVLSYTLPNEVVLEYAQMLREHCPACPLIVITDKNLGDRSIKPDAIVVADEGPDALLSAIRQVLKLSS